MFHSYIILFFSAFASFTVDVFLITIIMSDGQSDEKEWNDNIYKMKELANEL